MRNDSSDTPWSFAIRYLSRDVYRSARKHGVADADILHAVDHALGAAEQDDGKVLYLGADRAGNMLEVVSVTMTPRS